jgi:hypothetical protein
MQKKQTESKARTALFSRKEKAVSLETSGFCSLFQAKKMTF